MNTDATTVYHAAMEILHQQVHPIVGCRKIVKHLRGTGSAISNSEAALTIIAIESETDEFPVGEERHMWASASLIECDRQLDAYLVSVKGDISTACEALVGLLSETVRPPPTGDND